MRARIAPLKDFLHRESSSGIFLLAAAVLGLLVANSPLRSQYFSTLDSGFEIGGGLFYLKLTTLKVINYILMTVFFFVVGLEIKREVTSGHLATFRNAIMPFIAAIGGMALPAAIYLAIAGKTDSRGWGVPVATDIALAVGLLDVPLFQGAPKLVTSALLVAQLILLGILRLRIELRYLVIHQLFAQLLSQGSITLAFILQCSIALGKKMQPFCEASIKYDNAYDY